MGFNYLRTAELLPEEHSVLTTKSLTDPGTHLISLTRMKRLPQARSYQVVLNPKVSIGNPTPKPKHYSLNNDMSISNQYTKVRQDASPSSFNLFLLKS